MKVVLELQDQPSNIKKVTVRHDIVVGRGAECNLRLSAPQVSRRHCFLRVSSDGASLTDLDSSNGTWMNGSKLISGKRYEIEDGALLAVGPVKFVARVRSEVPVGEELEVHLQDDRIEAELSQPVDDSSAGYDVDATIADLPPEGDISDLAFSVEQAGISASEDEPTSDFLPSDSTNGLRSGAAEVIDLPELIDEDETYSVELIDEPTTMAESSDLISGEMVEVVEIAADEQIVELVDETEPADDNAMIVDEDELLALDEDEVLLLDADEVIDTAEVAKERSESAPLDVSGDEADELKNFLKGLE